MGGLTHREPSMLPRDLSSAKLRVAAVVDLYGPHGVPTQEFKFLLRHVVLKRSSKGSAENIQAWNEITPVWWVRNAGEHPDSVRRPPPILIVHGTHDTLVPIEDARTYSKAVKQMRERRGDNEGCVPDVYVEIPGAIHGFNFAHSPLSYALSDTVVRFLDALVPARSSFQPRARL